MKTHSIDGSHLLALMLSVVLAPLASACSAPAPAHGSSAEPAHGGSVEPAHGGSTPESKAQTQMPSIGTSLGIGGSTPESKAQTQTHTPSATEATPVAASDWTQAELEEMTAKIRSDLEQLRGEKFKRPVAVKLASREEFVKYAADRMEKTETPAKVASDEMFAKMLGLVPPDMNLMETTMKLLEEQVGGFYDPDTESFYLMRACPPGVARVILAHELDHALDDQLFDIDGRIEALSANSDALMAYQSVVEGSGTAVMAQWAAKHLAEVDMSGFSAMQDDANKSMAQAPAWLWKPLLAVYLRGAAFLARTDNVIAGQMKAATSADIRKAFNDPPRSMEQVLHPEKYWDAIDERDEPRKVEFKLSELPEGWQSLREETLGEFGLAILTTPPEKRVSPDFGNMMALLGIAFTNDEAQGWGGDRLVLLGKGDARLLQLVTVWDTQRDAGEFRGALGVIAASIESALSALQAQHEHEKYANAGVDVSYGAQPDEVVVRLHFGVDKKELKKLRGAIGFTVAPASAR